MGWTKLAVLIALLTVLFTVVIFGSYFGYSVKGVPQGIKAASDEKVTYQIGDIPFSDAEPTITVEDRDYLGEMMDFMWNLVTFQIDGMPDIFAYLFLLASIIVIYIIVSIFLPGGGS